MNYKLNLIVLFLLFFQGNRSFSQDIYDAAHSKEYGDHLFKSKEYRRAVFEYERTCFLDSQNWDAHFKLIKSYRKGGQANKGIIHFQNIHTRLPLPYLYQFEHEKNICVFETQPQIFIEKGEADSISDLKFFKAPALLLAHEWKQSKSYLLNVNYNHDKTLGKYYETSLQGLKLTYKKPWLAGTMSALVPGLGKVYTGYYKDGILAFLVTGITAYQAYRGYQAKGTKSGIFIIYSGLTAGFYLGNVYGSAKSARQKNRSMNESMDKKTKEIFYEWAE